MNCTTSRVVRARLTTKDFSLRVRFVNLRVLRGSSFSLFPRPLPDKRPATGEQSARERKPSLLDSLFYLILRFRAMRRCALFAIVILMSTVVAETAAQTLPAPQAVTDPTKISSKPNAQVEPRSLTIEKLYMTRQVGRPTWSPDGKSVAFISNMSGRNNLWLVPAEGGWPVQLTVSDQRQTAPAWSPDGKWIAYQSDYDGDEQWDIFLVSPKTGKVVNLTQTREIAEISPTWSPDGRYLAYEVKPKTSAAYEIDIYDMVMREV